jgi:hypothetical protein
VSCASADTGTLLIEFVLAADWMSAAASGVVGLNDLPLTGEGVADGEAGHYRIKDSAGTTCHEQGTVSEPDGGGDLIADNVDIAEGQTVTVTEFTKTEGGA